MNAKERILKAINHEVPDRVPSFELSIDNLSIYNYFNTKYGFQGNGDLLRKTYDLIQGNTELLKKFINKARKVSDSLTPGIELYMKAGIDLCCIFLANLPKIYQREGFVDDVGRIMHFKKNPSDDMDITYYMGGYFKDFEDYESFPPLDPDDPVREETFMAAKKLENEYKGKIYVAPLVCGIFEATWEGFGMELFSKLLVHSNKIKKIFDDRGKFILEMVKRISDWGEEDGLIVIGDDYGYKKGLIVSPRYYHEYVFPWIKRICNTAHDRGLKILLHSCGNIYSIFEDLIKCGVDAIHPFEPTTSNPDYDIFKLHEKYGDKVAFAGNVSPQDLADREPEFVQSYVKKLIKELAPGGGYILSSGHSINPAVKLENFLAMHETLKEFGQYPIQID